MQMPSQHETVTICCHYVPGGDVHMGIDALANALLLMTAGPALDGALCVAHDRAKVAQQRQARRRTLEAQMTALHVQLAVLEDQARKDVV